MTTALTKTSPPVRAPGCPQRDASTAPADGTRPPRSAAVPADRMPQRRRRRRRAPQDVPFYGY